MRAFILALFLMCTATGVQATLITSNGYTLNTQTNVVTGFGLRWLQWSETVGLTADEALARYPTMRFATFEEAADLLELFFGDSILNLPRGLRGVVLDDDLNPANLFSSLFGSTGCRTSTGVYGPCPPGSIRSAALFPASQSQVYGLVSVAGPVGVLSTPLALVNVQPSLIRLGGASTTYGFALVSTVGSPSSALLLLLGCATAVSARVAQRR